MSASDRERLIDKIRKLRAKGQNTGTTEAEANAFLDAAAKLMREHDVDDDDLAKAGIGIEPVEKKGVHTSIGKAHPACVCLEAIGQLTGTSIGLRVTRKIVDGAAREIGALTISGRPADRQIADYLYDQIRNMIDGAWAAERKSRLDRVAQVIRLREPTADVRETLAQTWMRQGMADAGMGIDTKARRSFGFGMAMRLAERIERMATRQADSANAMTVWREQTTVSEDKRRQKKLDLDMAAYGQGAKAGETADLGRGVETGQASVKGIGVDKCD